MILRSKLIKFLEPFYQSLSWNTNFISYRKKMRFNRKGSNQE